MTIGTVVGNIVCTVKHKAYQGTKLLLVQPVDPNLQPKGAAVVAVDTVGAGEGELVLVCAEGKAAREILGDPMAPVRSFVIGIVDRIDLGD